MTFIATEPASVIVAGIDRSTLPGPSVTTNIWPMPTMTKKVAKVSAAVSSSPPPWPPVKAMVASQTAIAATKDQSQGLSASAREALSSARLRPVDEGAERQHDDQDRALRADLPVGRDAQEGQERARRASASCAPITAPTGETRPPTKLAAAEDDAGDREQRVALGDVGLRRGGEPDQRQARRACRRSRRAPNIVTLALSSDQPARSIAFGIAARAAQDRAVGGAHQQRNGATTAMTTAAMIGKGTSGGLQLHQPGAASPAPCRRASAGRGSQARARRRTCRA